MWEFFKTFLDFIASKTWGTIAKLIVVVSVVFVLYELHNGSLTIYQPSKLVEFTSEQDHEMDKSIDMLLKHEHVAFAGISIYQPKGVPKEKVILYKGRTDYQSLEEVLKFPYIKKVRDLSENTRVYNQLQFKPAVIMGSDDTSYLGKFIKQDKYIVNILFIGLYKYGTPYGALIIGYDKPYDANCEHEVEFMEALRLQGIMFDK